jgi:hypothetical protein
VGSQGGTTTRDEIIERMNWLPSLAKETDSLIGKIERIVRAAEQAEREALTARILRCRYPVCNTIKPSGHDWDIPRLDEVIEAIRARGEK